MQQSHSSTAARSTKCLLFLKLRHSTFQLPIRSVLLVPLSHTRQSSWWAVIQPEAELTGFHRASTGVKEADAEPSRSAITKANTDVYCFWTFGVAGLSSPASLVHNQLTAGHGKWFIRNITSLISQRRQLKGNNRIQASKEKVGMMIYGLFYSSNSLLIWNTFRMELEHRKNP